VCEPTFRRNILPPSSGSKISWARNQRTAGAYPRLYVPEDGNIRFFILPDTVERELFLWQIRKFHIGERVAVRKYLLTRSTRADARPGDPCSMDPTWSQSLCLSVYDRGMFCSSLRQRWWRQMAPFKHIPKHYSTVHICMACLDSHEVEKIEHKFNLILQLNC
jgi:hypothetical protein